MLTLREMQRDEAVCRLQATLPPQDHAVRIVYRTRLGALLRVDGNAAGAFDREHHDVVLPPCERGRELSLDVERRALPTNGLPAGPGIVWWYFNATSQQRPSRRLRVLPFMDAPENGSHGGAAAPPDNARIAAFGHSHLDVAWLWTYEETARKAQRTFAIACDLLDRDPAFRFIQSQPQLYAFVERDDPQLFERVCAHVSDGRLDARVAALWVESDCNIPSGESLLRQMLYARDYCKDRFAIEPDVAWLPDTFGFMNTIPQLLAHAGIPYFSTTKLQWNDTTKFPHPQFVWQGPDGSTVVAALLQGYDGPAYPWRVSTAKQRNEPIALGYGDGGGGVTPSMLAYVRKHAEWIDLRAWFDALQRRRDELPVHADELYLEYHRGVYTTHHDVKYHNALCERALLHAEELLAWCVAVHVPKAMLQDHVQRLHDAWRIVLRQQFHDVLPGTSIAAVYDDVAREYAQAEGIIAAAISAAHAMLPRALTAGPRRRVKPHDDGDAIVFADPALRARVRRNGTIVELAAGGGRNVCTQANVLALYRDKPKAWEAWNVDRSYERRMRTAVPNDARIEDDALIVDLLCGSSPVSMRVELYEGEPFLRVTLTVDWRERRTLLRAENWFAVQTQTATYGAPHGSIVRSARDETPAERAKFEVPGQRYALVRDEGGDGCAIFALDTYGWNARALPNGGIRVGHSLLRGTCWPDPRADVGEHRLQLAYAPLAGASIGDVEHAWELFAHDDRVRLFTSAHANVLVVCCKPAHDGDGAIVRVRECNGEAVTARLRCGARMTWAAGVDGLERATHGHVGIEGEELVFDLRPFELRGFRVRFSHA